MRKSPAISNIICAGGRLMCIYIIWHACGRSKKSKNKTTCCEHFGMRTSSRLQYTFHNIPVYINYSNGGERRDNNVYRGMTHPSPPWLSMFMFFVGIFDAVFVRFKYETYCDWVWIRFFKLRINIKMSPECTYILYRLFLSMIGLKCSMGYCLLLYNIIF